jgi:glycosyltransferase involved in cell wall biosynthesis
MTDFTIITPSFNQGSFIDGFFKSYRQLKELSSYTCQLILVDNCSNDNTGAIIEDNKDLIDVLIVEPDHGQSDAINKAIPFIIGKFVNWINTDDRLTCDALGIVSTIFESNSNIEIVAGRCLKEHQSAALSIDRITTLGHPSLPPISLLLGQIIQPSTFWRRDTFLAYCPLREDLHYVMDHDLMMRYLLSNGPQKIAYTNQIIAKALLHENCKSVNSAKKFHREYLSLYKELYQLLCDGSQSLHSSYRGSEIMSLFARSEEIIALSRLVRRISPLGIPYPSASLFTCLKNPCFLIRYFKDVRPAMHYLNSM